MGKLFPAAIKRYRAQVYISEQGTYPRICASILDECHERLKKARVQQNSAKH